MRALCILLVILATDCLAQEANTRRPITEAEATALKEPIALALRLFTAWSRYAEVTSVSAPVGVGGPNLITDVPTLELFHATHSLSDSDFALSLRYHAAFHPVPRNAPKTAPLLGMRTDRGVLIFDTSGNITLEPTK